MKDMQKQTKNSLLYIFSMSANYLFPFITLPLFTRIFTKEDYGILALSEIYAVFINGLVYFGLNLVYDRNFFKYKNDSQKSAQLLYSILIFAVCNFLLFSVLTYLLKIHLSKFIFHSLSYGNILFYSLCAIFVIRFQEYYLAYFKNSENAKSYFNFTLMYCLVNLTLSIFMVVYLRLGIIGIVYARLFSAIIVCFILSYKFLNMFPLSFNRQILIESLKISYPLAPRLILDVIGTKIDKYLISLLASLGGVGIYSIAQKIAYSIFAYTSSLGNVFLPQTYKKMFDLKKQGGEVIGKYLTPFAFISIAIALFIVLFSEEIIWILVPITYYGAIDIVIILSMYYGFLFFGKVIGTQLIYAKKTHITSALTIAMYILNIALNIPFIMKWGAVGAAWATLLATLISQTFSFVIAQKYYWIKWEYKKISAIFLTFFISATSMVILRNINFAYGMRLLIKCIFISTYIYIGIKIDFVTKDNFKLIKDTVFLSWYKNKLRKLDGEILSQ